MHDVFISYKSDEIDNAMWLESVLEKNGIPCWIAPQNIPGGSNYGQEIPKAIENCRIFVLVLSKKAQESMWISKEVNMALNCKKIIMPFMIEDCELCKEFNFYLGDVQRYAAYRSKENATAQMIAEIKHILGKKEEEKDVEVNIPDEKSEEKKVKDKKKSKIMDKFKNRYSLLIILTYFLCIPGGVITTISYVIERFCAKNVKSRFIVTKTLCMLSVIVGCFSVYYAYFYWHDNAYFMSVFGIILGVICGDL